jgi:hypothetical protein
VLFANILVIVFSLVGFIIAKLEWEDIVVVVVYDTIVLFVMDVLKVWR